MEKTEKKSKVKSVLKWTALLSAVLGVGYVLGNDKTRGVVVGGVKAGYGKLKGMVSKPEPEETEEPASEETTETPEQEEQAPQENRQERRENRGGYNNDRRGRNYGYNRSNDDNNRK